MSRTRAAIFAIALLTLGVTPLGAQQSVLRRVGAVEEVFAAYEAGGRLFVHGDVGLGDAQIRRLVEFLRERPSWVAYVSADSSEQRFESPEGITERGFDAVKHTLGSLYNRTPFGSLPEPGGCIFALTLAEKDMTLYVGDGYKLAGIDHSDPRLFDGAREALRRGLRVGDAVVAVIDSTDAQLEKARVAAESARRRAEARARWTPFVWPVIIVISLLAWVGLARILTRNSRRRANELLARWRGEFHRHQAELIELRKWGEILAGNPRYEGRTKEMSAAIVDDVRHLLGIRASATATLDQAAGWVEPTTFGGKLTNFFLSRNYVRAIRRLTNEKIPFDPQSALGRLIAGEKIDPNNPLWSGIREIERPTRTFEQLVAELDERATRADESVRHIKNCTKIATSSLEVLSARIEQLATAQAEFARVRTSERAASLPSLATVLLPALRTRFDTAQHNGARDPVAAVHEVDACERRIQSAQELLDKLTIAADGGIAGLRDADRTLAERGLRTPWIESAIGELFADADAHLVQLAETGPIAPAPDVPGALAVLHGRVERTEALEERLRTVLDRDRDEVERSVLAAREDLATELGVDARALLREPDADPDVLLARARRAASAARQHMGEGQLDDAERELDVQRVALEEAREIVRDTRDSVARRAATIVRLEARAAALADEHLPRHRDLLSGMRERYAGSVFRTEEEDGAPGTVADNLEAADGYVEQAIALIASSGELFTDGAILQSAHALERATAFYDLVDLQLAEVQQRASLVEKAETDNAAATARIERDRVELDGLTGHFFVTETTRDRMQAASDRARSVLEAVEGGSHRDPFAIAERLSEVEESLAEIRRRIGSDQEAYAELHRSLALAEEMIERARTSAQIARDDQVVDSAAIDQQRGALGQLERDLDALQRSVGRAHAEWVDLDRSADRIHAEAVRCRDALQHEVERGREALQLVERAGERTRDARRADGSVGSPGKSSYVRAKESLQRGDYGAARRFAEASIEAADDAMTALALRQRRRVRATRSGANMDWTDVAVIAGDLLRVATNGWAHTRTRRSGSGPIIRPPKVSFPKVSKRSGGRRSSGSGFGKTHSW